MSMKGGQGAGRPDRWLGRVGGTAIAIAAALSPAAASATSAEAGQLAQSAERSFDIPAQPLSRAIVAFGDQAALQVTVDSAILNGLVSRPVSGSMAPEEALRRLLAGSGISWRFADPRTLVLSRPAAGGAGGFTLDPVTVEARMVAANPAAPSSLPPAYAGGQVARGGQLGLLGNRDFMDTPFAATSYTAEALRNQQAATLADALANDPSVRVDIRGRGTNNGGGDQFNIRGFRFPNSDVAFNGMYGVLPVGTVAMETAERVEVFKGPSALLNGMAPSGGVGGGVNIVPKRAGDEPLTRLTATYGSDSQAGGHIDAGRRFGDAKEFGLRVNGVYRNGDTAVDDQSSELGVAALGADFRGERLRLSLDLGFQSDRTDVPGSWGGGLRIGPAVTELQSAPDAHHRTAQLWEYADNEDRYGVLRGEYDLADDVTLFAGIGGRTYDLRNLRTNSVLVDNSGTLLSTPSYYPQFVDSWSAQAGLLGSLHTGPVRHDWSLGASALTSEGGYGYEAFAGGSSNLYAAATLPDPDDGSLSSATKSYESRLRSFAVADTLSVLDDRVQLTVGLRHQQVERDGFDIASGARTSSYDEAVVTPAVGFVLKPWRQVAVYANYIEGLSEGGIAPAGTENAGEVFPPARTEQREAGVKFDRGAIAATVAVFEITQPNAITTTGSTPGSTIYRIDGEQRNRGVELSAFGEIAPELRLLGGVTYLQATQTRTQGGINDGKEAIGVPNWLANLGVEWDAGFADGLTFSARAIVTDAQYANAGNTLSVAGWTRFDLGARYRLPDRPLEIRANVLNLLDQDYWESVSPSTGLRLGTPRTLLLSLSMDF